MGERASIIERLRKDVEAWASNCDTLLTGERDMQIRLAIWLEKECGWKVHTEYRVPLPELTQRQGIACNARKGDKAFPWPNDISVDIVVECGKEYAALELKYATRPVDAGESIFNEPLMDANSQILKDQGAADLVMYNYWKDVRRIEALTSAFSALKGGVALIITNNHTFIKKPEGTPSYMAFATYEGNKVGPGELRWGGKAQTIMQSHPAMELKGWYPCTWRRTKMPYVSADRSKETFHYMISTIDNI